MAGRQGRTNTGGQDAQLETAEVCHDHALLLQAAVLTARSSPVSVFPQPAGFWQTTSSMAHEPDAEAARAQDIKHVTSGFEASGFEASGGAFPDVNPTSPRTANAHGMLGPRSSPPPEPHWLSAHTFTDQPPLD